MIYAITITQSNLKYALLILSCYCSNSNSIYTNAIIKLLRYVKELLYYNIYYKKNENLIEYTNIDFAKTINNRYFTSK